MKQTNLSITGLICGVLLITFFYKFIWLDSEKVSTDLAVTQGLLAWYPFNGNANDASGHQHHGKVHEAVPAVDRFGMNNSAYSFDGINDFIAVEHDSSFEGLNTLSLVAWIYVRKASFYPAVVGKGNVGNYKESYALFLNPQNRLGFLANSNGTASGRDLIIDFTIPTAKWIHIASSYDGSMMRTYVNGIEIGSVAHQGGIFTTGEPLLIGKSERKKTRLISSFFNGLIDDVLIYNRAISPDEVKTLYLQDGGSDRFGG